MAMTPATTRLARGLTVQGGTANRKANALYDVVRTYRQYIDCVGFQSHFNDNPNSIISNDLQANIQRFADLGFRHPGRCARLAAHHPFGLSPWRTHPQPPAAYRDEPDSHQQHAQRTGQHHDCPQDRFHERLLGQKSTTKDSRLPRQRLMSTADRQHVCELLDTAVQHACKRVHDLAAQNPECRGMGTTMSVLVVSVVGVSGTVLLIRILNPDDVLAEVVRPMKRQLRLLQTRCDELGELVTDPENWTNAESFAYELLSALPRTHSR